MNVILSTVATSTNWPWFMRNHCQLRCACLYLPLWRDRAVRCWAATQGDYSGRAQQPWESASKHNRNLKKHLVGMGQTVGPRTQICCPSYWNVILCIPVWPPGRIWEPWVQCCHVNLHLIRKLCETVYLLGVLYPYWPCYSLVIKQWPSVNSDFRRRA